MLCSDAVCVKITVYTEDIRGGGGKEEGKIRFTVIHMKIPEIYTCNLWIESTYIL